MKRKLLVAAVVMMGSVLSACAAHGAYVVRSGPPPAPRYGVVGVAPGPGYVWMDGFWDWRGANWHWMPGRWVVPPRPHAVWVPGYWSPHGRDYRFRPGHWR
jgi:hypothetical protein